MKTSPNMGRPNGRPNTPKITERATFPTEKITHNPVTPRARNPVQTQKTMLSKYLIGSINAITIIGTKQGKCKVKMTYNTKTANSNSGSCPKNPANKPHNPHKPPKPHTYNHSTPKLRRIEILPCVNTHLHIPHLLPQTVEPSEHTENKKLSAARLRLAGPSVAALPAAGASRPVPRSGAVPALQELSGPSGPSALGCASLWLPLYSGGWVVGVGVRRGFLVFPYREPGPRWRVGSLPRTGRVVAGAPSLPPGCPVRSPSNASSSLLRCGAVVTLDGRGTVFASLLTPAPSLKTG